MIAALLIGRKGSVGFPDKNITMVLGRPMAAYPLIAAIEARHVDVVYVSTDSIEIKEIATGYGAKVIDRPAELCTNTAFCEDVYRHGYEYIRDTEGEEPQIMVLLMCNAVAILGKTIDEGIEALRNDETLDSAVTVSRYNMWSPLRARRVDNEGLLRPFVPFEAIADPKTLNCDRDSQGDVWFADMGVSVIRPRNLMDIENGLLPQKWMGKRIYPLRQWGGLDVDYEWQLPQIEYWLRKNRSLD